MQAMYAADIIPEIGTAAPNTFTSAAINLRRITHKTIREYTNDLETFAYNRGVARLRTLSNELFAFDAKTSDEKWALREGYEVLIQLLAPITPHICEELWERFGYKTLVCNAQWPQHREELTEETQIIMPVQVNGKLRGTIDVPVGAAEDVIKKSALERVASLITGKTIQRVIIIKDKIINIVVA